LNHGESSVFVLAELPFTFLSIQMEGQLTPLQARSAQALEAAEVERKSKERDRAKRGRDAKKEAHEAALKEADGLRKDNASLHTRRWT
jgi:hypothetical protein